MAVKVTNTKPLHGNSSSYALNATRRQQKPNLQVVRLADGTRIRMSAREAKSFRKEQKMAS